MRQLIRGAWGLRDELNQPLGLRPTPAPLAARLRPLGGWAARLAVVALAASAGALYWRSQTLAPGRQVAVIPFAAIKTPVATPSASPIATAAEIAKVFPPQADGGVSIVRSGGASVANGHSPQIIEVAQALAGRLAPAPDRRLIEPSKFGPLPRIGADGARPYDIYARPFAETALTRGAPRIAVFVGGLGLDAQTTQAAISRLPPAVSLGLAPYGDDLAKVAESARNAGHEIWLQAPMETLVGADPGPHTLKTGASAAENQDSLHWMMGRFGGYVGIVNYLGGKFSADADAVSPVLAEIARRGLLYLDDGASPLSKATDLAPGLDLKAARADIVAEGGDIEAALARAEDIARRRGAVFVVASALPQTLDRVARWAAGLEGKGFALEPASALTLAKPDRAANVAR